MEKSLKNLSSKRYPGRIIIIGKDLSGKNIIVLYAITGRSPSSRARKIALENDCIWVKPVNQKTLEGGNIELLIYPAVYLSQRIVVSNGKQTTDIIRSLDQSQNPVDAFATSLNKWDYEPDPPAYTPRISGCVFSREHAALSIIKRAADGSSVRHFFEIPLIAGKGKMITTYSGENKDPLPSYSGEPVDVALSGITAQETAEIVYDALKPPAGQEDFRVGLASVFCSDLQSKKFNIFLINWHERVKT